MCVAPDLERSCNIELIACRVYELRDQGEMLPVIAGILNCEGFRSAVGGQFTPVDIWRILGQRRSVLRIDRARMRP